MPVTYATGAARRGATIGWPTRSMREAFHYEFVGHTIRTPRHEACETFGGLLFARSSSRALAEQ